MLSEIIKTVVKKVGAPQGPGAGLILRTMNLAHAGLSRWGLGFLGLRPGVKILDIGCGGGANLRQMLKSGAFVRGLDPSPVSVEVSKKAASEAEGHLEVKLGGAQAIPWPDQEFDIVTAFETVYFWPDRKACFQEVARVLKPGGLFQITNSLNPGLDPAYGRFWVETLDIQEAAQADFGAIMIEAGLEKIQRISGVKQGLIVRGHKPA